MNKHKLNPHRHRLTQTQFYSTQEMQLESASKAKVPALAEPSPLSAASS